jgi:hypothetical protein
MDIIVVHLNIIKFEILKMLNQDMEELGKFFEYIKRLENIDDETIIKNSNFDQILRIIM